MGPADAGWRLLITLEAEFCLDAVQEALARHGKPEIFNTDQGSQFTSAPFTGMLQDQAIRISMDGRGAWRDNVFVERLWRSVKYEEVYLRAYDSVSEARASLGRYLAFYNGRRPHFEPGREDAGSGPISTICRRRWQHDNATGAVALLESGSALPAPGHGPGETYLSTGGKATYRDRNAVAGNRATSDQRRRGRLCPRHPGTPDRLALGRDSAC